MSEDLPLDPNQVSPPEEVQGDQLQQEGDTVHIEVARPDATSSGAPAASDEQVGPNYIKNKDKAEVMARAQDAAYKENEKDNGRYLKPEYAAKKAGEDYDLDVALNTERWSHISTPEEAREFASANRRVFLKYSHAIAENYKKYGDKLGPNLQALELVHELVGDSGHNNFATKNNSFGFGEIMVELDESAGGAILVTSGRVSVEPKEQWRLPMFGGGEYMVALATGDPAGEFGRVETIKTRSLGDEDVARLGELLRPAVRHRQQAEKRRQEADVDQDDDDRVSTQEIRSRARAAGLSAEEAREAAEMYPGDFM